MKVVYLLYFQMLFFLVEWKMKTKKKKRFYVVEKSEKDNLKIQFLLNILKVESWIFTKYPCSNCRYSNSEEN